MRTIPEKVKEAATKTRQPARTFGGKMSDYADNQERHFYQRMLKAYHNGRKTFNFGFDANGDAVTHQVLINYPEVKNELEGQKTD